MPEQSAQSSSMTAQGSLYMGLDLGQAQDYTALSILETPPETAETAETPETLVAQDAEGIKGIKGIHTLRHLERPPLNTSYPAIVAHVAKLLRSPQLQRRPVEALVIDATGVGRAVLDMFREANLPVSIAPVSITPGSRVTYTDGMYYVPKRDLVGALMVLNQNHQLRMPSERRLPLTAILKAELLNFKAKISAAGHDSYEAGGASDWREGQHDDLVLSVALVAWYVTRQSSARIASAWASGWAESPRPRIPEGEYSEEQQAHMAALARSLDWLNGLRGT